MNGQAEQHWICRLTNQPHQFSYESGVEVTHVAPGRAEGVVVSVTIRELLDGRSKISVRSNPEVDACAICAVYGGGGHKMASGCTLDCGTETAVEKILAAIDQVWPA